MICVQAVEVSLQDETVDVFCRKKQKWNVCEKCREFVPAKEALVPSPNIRVGTINGILNKEGKDEDE